MIQEDLEAMVAFTRARLTEYEQAARQSLDAPADALRYVDADEWTEGLIGLASEGFVLRDVEAKRKIIDRCEHIIEVEDAWGLVTFAEEMLLLQAAPYAGHADYQQRWKP